MNCPLSLLDLFAWSRSAHYIFNIGAIMFGERASESASQRQEHESKIENEKNRDTCSVIMIMVIIIDAVAAVVAEAGCTNVKWLF